MIVSGSTSVSPIQDLSGACILVLDDDANMRSLIRGMLTRCGCRNVLPTGDGREGLRLFSSRKIDLVISDWAMEPMSGLQFLRELRRPERANNVPVIMLTASSDPKDVILAQPFRISGWLVKPISPRALAEQVSAVLRLPEKSLSLEGDLAIDVRELTEQYRAKLANDLSDMEAILAAMPQQARNLSYSWRSIARTLHNIKGQAGSFGYGLVTAIAALGMELVRPLENDVALVYDHQGDLCRCVAALVQAMRLVLQNGMQGDGGVVGERLLEKLKAFTAPMLAKLSAVGRTGH